MYELDVSKLPDAPTTEKAFHVDSETGEIWFGMLHTEDKAHAAWSVEQKRGLERNHQEIAYQLQQYGHEYMQGQSVTLDYPMLPKACTIETDWVPDNFRTSSFAALRFTLAHGLALSL